MAGGTCADCGKGFPHLHRHHIIARAEGGTDDESNLVGLCPNCHTLRHDGPFGRNVPHRPRKAKKPQRIAAPTIDSLEPAHILGNPIGVEVTLRSDHLAFLCNVAQYQRVTPNEVLQEILNEQLYGDRRSRGETERTVNKGERYTLSEWAIVTALLRSTDLRYSHLVKAALSDYAAKHGLKWPNDPTRTAA